MRAAFDGGPWTSYGWSFVPKRPSGTVSEIRALKVGAIMREWPVSLTTKISVARGSGRPPRRISLNNVYSIAFDEKGAAFLCIPLRGNVMNSLSRLPSTVDRPFLQRASSAAIITQRRCNRRTPCVATTHRVLAREILRHYARVIPGVYG